MDNVEAILLQQPRFRDLYIYCKRFDKDFSAIVTYYEQNPAQYSFAASGREMRLPAQLELRKILGMSIEDARKVAHTQIL